MKGEGAIVFLVAFVVFLAATFAYPSLPLGSTITEAMDIDPDLVWSGFTLKTLLSAVFNGIIYGVIIWLIFTFVRRTQKPKT